LNELKELIASGKDYVKKVSTLFEPINAIKSELEKEKTRYGGLMDGYKNSMK
jgi:hypothetical protein